MKNKTFKTRDIYLTLLCLCLDKPKCSKELARELKNPRDDRNIHKYVLKLEKSGLLREVEKPKDTEYTKSRFFIVDNKNLSKEVKNEMKNNKYIITPRRKQSITIFKEMAEKWQSGDKTFLEFKLFDKNKRKGFTKIAEISDVK